MYDNFSRIMPSAKLSRFLLDFCYLTFMIFEENYNLLDKIFIDRGESLTYRSLFISRTHFSSILLHSNILMTRKDLCVLDEGDATKTFLRVCGRFDFQKPVT